LFMLGLFHVCSACVTFRPLPRGVVGLLNSSSAGVLGITPASSTSSAEGTARSTSWCVEGRVIALLGLWRGQGGSEFGMTGIVVISTAVGSSCWTLISLELSEELGSILKRWMALAMFATKPLLDHLQHGKRIIGKRTGKERHECKRWRWRENRFVFILKANKARTAMVRR